MSRPRQPGAVRHTRLSHTSAASAALPSIAAGEAAGALVRAGSGPGAVARAETEARLAERLDPLSDAGLKVQATIASGRRDYAQARALLRQAVGREPDDVQAWQELAMADLLVGSLTSAVRAAEHASELDPLGLMTGEAAYTISQVDDLLSVPPQDSATAHATPALPPPPAPPAAAYVPYPRSGYGYGGYRSGYAYGGGGYRSGYAYGGGGYRSGYAYGGGGAASSGVAGSTSSTGQPGG